MLSVIHNIRYIFDLYVCAQKRNAEWEAVNGRLSSKNESLKAEIQRLRSDVAVYQEEQKESEMRISELENEVKELKLMALDPSQFMEWDGESVLHWIMSLEDGRFKPYENVIRQSLIEEQVRGSHLSDVNEVDVKGWGVKPFDDKKALARHIQNLVKRYGVIGRTQPKGKEGSHTDFLH